MQALPSLLQQLRRLRRDEDGVTAIEYALIAALVAAAIAVGATLLGTNIGAMFTKLAGLIV
ncbi:MAG: Flp family type IVb pilin [Sphingomonadaceae bacterium]